MKNNTRGLIFHIIVVIITFIMASIINLSTKITNIVYGNFIFKGILTVFIIFLYYNFAKGMNKRVSIDYI